MLLSVALQVRWLKTAPPVQWAGPRQEQGAQLRSLLTKFRQPPASPYAAGISSPVFASGRNRLTVILSSLELKGFDR